MVGDAPLFSSSHEMASATGKEDIHYSTTNRKTEQLFGVFHQQEANIPLFMV